MIFHGKISQIYDFLDQIYSTDEDYSKNKPNSITNYSYPSFIQEQSKMYITMFQFNMEQSYSFVVNFNFFGKKRIQSFNSLFINNQFLLLQMDRSKQKAEINQYS